jgi:hypothetical protein
MVESKNYQIRVISERLEARGIPRDLIDVENLIDSTCNLSENWDSILEEIGNYNTTQKEIMSNLKGDKFEEQKIDCFRNLQENINDDWGKYLKDFRTIGVVGNPNCAKSSLVLNRLIEIREKYKINVYVFGVESALIPYLKSRGIEIIHNKEDILDMKLTGCLIYIDEFADFFSVRTQDKQLERLKRFFNRIYHLNNWFIIATAQTGFWNKFMNGIVKCFIVKEIEYENLVNGTTLKRKVLGMPSSSDYRFECPKNTYYVLTDILTQKHGFTYNPLLDSKKDNKNPFGSYNPQKNEIKDNLLNKKDEFSEQKTEKFSE